MTDVRIRREILNLAVRYTEDFCKFKVNNQAMDYQPPSGREVGTAQAVTEGACVTLSLDCLYCNALSLRHFLTKMTPPSRREADRSIVRLL